MSALAEREIPLALPASVGSLINLSKNQPMVSASQAEQPTFEESLRAWAEKEMAPGERDRLMKEAARPALLERAKKGERVWRFDYSPGKETEKRRLYIRFLSDPLSGDTLCVCNLCRVTPAPAGGAASPESRQDEALLQAVAQSYDAVCRFRLGEEKMGPVRVLHDRISFFPVHPEEEPLEDWARKCANSAVREAWRQEYTDRFAPGALREAAKAGKTLVSCTFETEGGLCRQDCFLCAPEGGGKDLLCMAGVMRVREEGRGGSLMTRQALSESDSRRVADMEMEMSFERHAMKKRTRRLVFFFFLMALVIGLAGAPVLNHYTGFYQQLTDRIFPPAATEAPKEEAEAEATPAVQEAETVITRAAWGQEVSFTSETYQNGTARTAATEEEFESQEMTARMEEVRRPEDFAEKYKQYLLDGTEACVHFSLSFAQVKEEERTVNPEEAYQIWVTDRDGLRVEEYQLMDKEIAGAYGVTVKDGATAQLYRRYLYDAKIEYLVLAYYQEGVRHEIWFSLRGDDPNAPLTALKNGNNGPGVEALNQELMDQGYLTGKVGRGYNAATVKAVKAAQEALGLEVTGEADEAFLKALYSVTW